MPIANGSSTMSDKLMYFTRCFVVQNEKSNDEFVNIPHIEKDFFSKSDLSSSMKIK